LLIGIEEYHTIEEATSAPRQKKAEFIKSKSGAKSNFMALEFNGRVHYYGSVVRVFKFVGGIRTRPTLWFEKYKALDRKKAFCAVLK